MGGRFSDFHSHSPLMSTFVNNALLLATLPDLLVPHFLTQVIASATTQTRKRLVIVFFSRHFNTRSEVSPTCPDIQGLSHTKSWDSVQRILTFTYVQATKVAWEANKIQMQVDVLLKGLNEDLDHNLSKDVDIVFRVSGGKFRSFLSPFYISIFRATSSDSIAVPLPESISFLRQSYLPAGEQNPERNTIAGATSLAPSLAASDLPPFYPVTIIGGTFDHLHAGHKILLSMAAYITSQKLIIGVTGIVPKFPSVQKVILIKQTTLSSRRKPTENFWKTLMYGPSKLEIS